jgi:hypothetical protein
VVIAASNYANGFVYSGSFTFTFTLSPVRAASAFGSANIQITSGNCGLLVKQTSQIYTMQCTGTQGQQTGVYVLDGITLLASLVVVTDLSPPISITTVADNGATTNESPITFTMQLSRDVTIQSSNLDCSDNCDSSTLSKVGNSYQIVCVAVDGQTSSVSIPLSAYGLSGTVSWSVISDLSAPVATFLVSGRTYDTPIVISSQDFRFDLSFNEAVQGVKDGSVVAIKQQTTESSATTIIPVNLDSSAQSLSRYHLLIDDPGQKLPALYIIVLQDQDITDLAGNSVPMTTGLVLDYEPCKSDQYFDENTNMCTSCSDCHWYEMKSTSCSALTNTTCYLDPGVASLIFAVVFIVSSIVSTLYQRNHNSQSSNATLRISAGVCSFVTYLAFCIFIADDVEMPISLIFFVAPLVISGALMFVLITKSIVSLSGLDDSILMVVSLVCGTRILELVRPTLAPERTNLKSFGVVLTIIQDVAFVALALAAIVQQRLTFISLSVIVSFVFSMIFAVRVDLTSPTPKYDADKTSNVQHGGKKICEPSGSVDDMESGEAIELDDVPIKHVTAAAVPVATSKLTKSQELLSSSVDDKRKKDKGVSSGKSRTAKKQAASEDTKEDSKPVEQDEFYMKDFRRPHDPEGGNGDSDNHQSKPKVRNSHEVEKEKERVRDRDRDRDRERQRSKEGKLKSSGEAKPKPSAPDHYRTEPKPSRADAALKGPHHSARAKIKPKYKTTDGVEAEEIEGEERRRHPSRRARQSNDSAPHSIVYNSINAMRSSSPWVFIRDRMQNNRPNADNVAV